MHWSAFLAKPRCEGGNLPHGHRRKFFETSGAPETQQERTQLKQTLSSFRTVLSVDRLDYSKSILNRLEGFDLLLERIVEIRGLLFAEHGCGGLSPFRDVGLMSTCNGGSRIPPGHTYPFFAET